MTSSGKGIRPLTVWVAVGAGVAAFALIALLMNIAERRDEARTPFFSVVALTDTTDDPAVWGQNFPQQYDSYQRTVDMQRTRFGGSESEPRDPSPDDPRLFTARSNLDRVPQLKRMWAGYSFSVDYREKRGHAYMLDDQTFTQRQVVVQQPGTCINCHGSTYRPMRSLGNGDVTAGFVALNQMTYQEARTHVTGPISCLDCHDPTTMQLRISRPAFVEGIAAYQASLGVADYDVNTMATRQEMRSYICAQCHVEYYFSKPDKRLVFPWARGLSVDSILAYYEAMGFVDWTHGETGAPMLKAQHPEFETWSNGIHGRAGVACADCHMPYERVGAMKVSDHHVRSPLLNINKACQTCHKVDADELLGRAETIQAKTERLSHVALDALVDLIDDIVAAQAAGRNQADLADALGYQRKASFLVDFVESENSQGFHADQESARILAESINYSRLGQMAVGR